MYKLKYLHAKPIDVYISATRTGVSAKTPGQIVEVKTAHERDVLLKLRNGRHPAFQIVRERRAEEE